MAKLLPLPLLLTRRRHATSAGMAAAPELRPVSPQRSASAASAPHAFSATPSPPGRNPHRPSARARGAPHKAACASGGGSGAARAAAAAALAYFATQDPSPEEVAALLAAGAPHALVALLADCAAHREPSQMVEPCCLALRNFASCGAPAAAAAAAAALGGAPGALARALKASDAHLSEAALAQLARCAEALCGAGGGLARALASEGAAPPLAQLLVSHGKSQLLVEPVLGALRALAAGSAEGKAAVKQLFTHAMAGAAAALGAGARVKAAALGALLWAP